MSFIPLEDVISADEKGANDVQPGWVDIAAFKIDDLSTYGFPYELVPFARIGKRVVGAYMNLKPFSVRFSLHIKAITKSQNCGPFFSLEFMALRNGTTLHDAKTEINSAFSGNDAHRAAMKWRLAVVDAVSFYNAIETEREEREAARWQQLLDTIADLPNVAIAGGHYREVEQRFNANKRRRPDDDDNAAPLPDGEDAGESKQQ